MAEQGSTLRPAIEKVHLFRPDAACPAITVSSVIRKCDGDHRLERGFN